MEQSDLEGRQKVHPAEIPKSSDRRGIRICQTILTQVRLQLSVKDGRFPANTMKGRYDWGKNIDAVLVTNPMDGGYAPDMKRDRVLERIETVLK